MKKLYTLLTVVLMSVAAYAQTGHEKGFILRPEVNLGLFSVGTFEDVCSINTFVAGGYGLGKMNEERFIKNEGAQGLSISAFANYGYQFNHFIFLGAGLGVAGNNGSVSLPIYINPRLYLSRYESGCFFDFKIGYAIGLSASSAANDNYYMPTGLGYKTAYYYDGNPPTGNFQTTEDYTKFMDVESSEMSVKGYYFSVAFGYEWKRSNIALGIDMYNVNLKTTVKNHYYSYADNEVHGAEEAPTESNTTTKTYDDSNKMGVGVVLKYSYRVF